MSAPTMKIVKHDCIFVEMNGYTICIDTSIPQDGIWIGYWKPSDGGSIKNMIGDINLPNTEDLGIVDHCYTKATNQPTLYVSPKE